MLTPPSPTITTAARLQDRAVDSVTAAARLQDRAVDNVCFSYYLSSRTTISSITCSVGTGCAVEAALSPAVFHCSGQNAATDCFDYNHWPSEGCNQNQICCASASPLCNTWTINGGSGLMRYCWTTFYPAAAWDPNWPGFTGIPQAPIAKPPTTSAVPTTSPPSPSPTITSPTSTPTSTPTSSSSSSDIGIFAGAAIGGLVLVAAVIWGLWYCCCQRPRNSWWNTRNGKYQSLGATMPPPGRYSVTSYHSVPPAYQSPITGGYTGYQMGPIISPPTETPPAPIPLARPQKPSEWPSTSPGKTITYRVEYIPASFTRDDVRNRLFPLPDRMRISVRSLAPSLGNNGQGTQTATVEYAPLIRSNGPALSNEATSLGIHADRDFRGWTPLNQPSGGIYADVIAVTGMAGHAFGSWSVDQNMWLRDFLPRDISNIRVMTYGYNSQLTEFKSRQDFDQHAEDFSAGLEDIWKSTFFTRPTIFIGHSLGCLIIKKALFISKGWRGRPDRLEDIVPMVIFMGAPHNGLATDALMMLVKGKASESLVEELKPGSPTLNNLKFRFEDIAQNVRILSIFERLPTKTAIEKNGKWSRDGPPVMMVERQNAVTYLPLEQRISSDTDHRDIARLRHTDGGTYGQIKRAISNVIEIQLARSLGTQGPRG